MCNYFDNYVAVETNARVGRLPRCSEFVGVIF